jgi:hypothetical protein
MISFFKKAKPGPSTLGDVATSLHNFYNLPDHHEFHFLNAAGNRLKSNRLVEVIKFAVPESVAPTFDDRYAKIWEIVLDRYRPHLDGLHRVRIWDNVRNLYVNGNTQAP